jgi:hypothetical protein
VLLVSVAVSCGKKGPPLPPLVRVPAPINAITARRVGDEVFLTFKVPSQNIDGSTPADIASVEVFALTTDAPPPPVVFLQRATRIATLTVPPPSSSSAPAREPSPGTVNAGDEVTVHDALVGDALVPVTIPPEKGRAAGPAEAPSAAGAGTAPGQPTKPSSPRRYYVAVASSARQRASPAGGEASVSIATSPPPPAGVVIDYDERTMTLSWSGGAKGEKYNVYRDVGDAAAASPTAPVPIPMPLNGSPLEATAFTMPVEFNREICLRVRAVRVEESGESVEGVPSEPTCKSPVDMFPPAPPADVTAVAGTDGITIQWSPNAEPDLAGYLVLRGAPGDATLAPITMELQKSTRYVDKSVMPGVRYVYAVVAIDNAPDANRSKPSARDEATAR